MFIRRVAALFLTIIHTDPNSMSARKERVFLLMIKNIEVCKKEYTFLKLRWEKWGTYLSKILTCNNKSSHRKNEKLSNWACVVIFCLLIFVWLMCIVCWVGHASAIILTMLRMYFLYTEFFYDVIIHWI